MVSQINSVGKAVVFTLHGSLSAVLLLSPFPSARCLCWEAIGLLGIDCVWEDYRGCSTLLLGSGVPLTSLFLLEEDSTAWEGCLQRWRAGGHPQGIPLLSFRCVFALPWLQEVPPTSPTNGQEHIFQCWLTL